MPYLEKFQSGLRKIQPIWGLILIALALRFIFAPFTSHPWDMASWIQRGEFFFALGINPFTQWLFSSISLAINLLSYSFGAILGNGNVLALQFFIKLPFILADIGIGILLYLLAEQNFKNKKLSAVIAAAWLLNPFVIFVSSVHGMFDSIPAFFILLALFYLSNKKYEKSVVAIVLSAIFKYFSIFLLPFFVLFLFNKIGFGKKIKTTIICIILFAISFLPLILLPGINSIFFQSISYHASGYQLGIKEQSIFYLPTISGLLANLPTIIANNLFWILFIPIYLAILFIFYLENKKGTITNSSFIVYLAVILLLMIPLNPNTTVQFLVWVLPLLFLISILHKLISFTWINIVWIVGLLSAFTVTSPFTFLLNADRLAVATYYWPFAFGYLAARVGFIYAAILILTAVFLFMNRNKEAQKSHFEYAPEKINKEKFEIRIITVALLIVVFLFVLFLLVPSTITEMNKKYSENYVNKERIYNSTFSYFPTKVEYTQSGGENIMNVSFLPPTYYILDKNLNGADLFYCINSIPLAQKESTITVKFDGEIKYTYKLDNQTEAGFTLTEPYLLSIPKSNSPYWCSKIIDPNIGDKGNVVSIEAQKDVVGLDLEKSVLLIDFNVSNNSIWEPNFFLLVLFSLMGVILMLATIIIFFNETGD